MAKFKVGDRVVMNKKANSNYTITQEGSWGFVTKVDFDSISVKFMEYKGPYNNADLETYTIVMSCADLMEPFDKAKVILNKINNMYTRQPYYAKQKAIFRHRV